MTTPVRRQPKVSSATFILVSVFILLGGLLPMIEPSATTSVPASTHFTWFNLSGLSDPATAQQRYKFLLLYPMLGAVLVSMVSLFAYGLTRQLIILFTGVIPIFALVNVAGVRGLFGVLGDVVTAGHGVGSVVGWAAWTALFVGAFGLLHCAQGKNLAQIAGGGAALWALALILPMGPEGHAHMAVAQPFVLMLSDPAELGIAGPRWAAVLMGVAQAMGLLMMTLAAVKGVILALATPTSAKGATATLALLCVAGAFWLLGTVLAGWGMYPTNMLLPTNYPGIALAVVKLTLWWFGLFLLIPLAMTDLALSFAPMVEGKQRAAEGSAPDPSPVVP